jgi:hypothetical protein
VTNTVTASGSTQVGPVSDTDTADFTIVSRDIDVEKSISPVKGENGTTVDVDALVTNTGTATITGLTAVDSHAGALTCNVTSLAAGEAALCEGSYVATGSPGDTVTNTVTASGSTQVGPVSDTDTADFTVVSRCIEITKTCTPDTQLAPGTITWNITVHNCGTLNLTNVQVWDANVSETIPGLPPSGTWSTTWVQDGGLPPGDYTNTAYVTAESQVGPVEDQATATCSVTPVYILKQFTGAFAINGSGFEPPTIDDGGVHSDVVGLHSGPRIFWEVTYFFENTLDFLGDDFDGECHYFTMWDKWGGNLMVLDSPPVAFNETTNEVMLANNQSFDINPRLNVNQGGYKDYVHPSLDISGLASQGDAWITLHSGDQQEGTNPGKGGGSHPKDGKSYDADIRWDIGLLCPGESATLTVIVAPGKNPGGKLQFSSPGCLLINTGPRVRVYADDGYANEDFMYAVSRTNQLEVCAEDFPPT